MSTQYDTIGQKFNSLTSFPTSKIQQVAIRSALLPLPPSSKTLELACGTGLYTQKLVSWGADHVTAIDISPAMVSIAQDSFPPDKNDRVSFHVMDCASPEMWKLPGLEGKEGSFDVVLAVWLLNYAANGEELQRMLKNIYRALKPGGKFVGLTINVAAINLWKENDLDIKGEKHLGSAYEMIERVDEGWKGRFRGFVEPKVEFDFFFLREEVYAKAAEEAGLGELEWKVVLPEREEVDALGEDYWKPYLKRPKAAVCTAKKSK